MKLYWSTRSPFARKVMVFAHETDLVPRIQPVATFVSNTKPNRDLLRINPLGKIPTLITDDGMALFDSYVICEYLDSLHGGARLIPPEGKARWQALRWHSVGNNMLDNLVPWRNEVLRPQAQQSPETLAGFELKIRAAVRYLDRDAATLGAAAVGIGHVAIACALGYMDFRFPALAWREGNPGIAGWYGAFAQRPSIRNTMPFEE